MLQIFLDSDVVIASLISHLGASYQLINSKNIQCFISNLSYQEIILVIEKLGLEKWRFLKLAKERLRIIKLKETNQQIKSLYKKYVKDVNDAHIVAGAVKSKVKFIITYNVKDFQINLIKEKFNLLIMTPGLFLQFLRSKK